MRLGTILPVAPKNPKRKLLLRLLPALLAAGTTPFSAAKTSVFFRTAFSERNIPMAPKTNKTKKKIISELEKIAFSSDCDSEVKLNYRIKALELLGKHVGLFDSDTTPDCSDDGLLDAIKSCSKLWKDELL